MPTLLEKIKSVPTQPKGTDKPSEQEIELFLAYVKGQVRNTQIAKVLYPDSKLATASSMINFRAFKVLRYLLQNGYTIKKA